MSLSWNLFLSAFLGSLACTIVILSVLAFVLSKYKDHFLSRIDQLIEKRVSQERARIGDEIQERVKEGVSAGITRGVSSIPSTEVLKQTHRTIAKTGREIVGTSIQSIFGRRQPPSQTHPENE